MSALLTPLLGLLRPFVTGFIAHYATEGVDWIRKTTNAPNVPVAGKQAIVVLISAGVAALSSALGVHLVPDGTPAADVLNNVDFNALAGALFAIALKHGKINAAS